MIVVCVAQDTSQRAVCNDENEKKTSNAARNVSTKENFVVQEVPHTMVSELWRPQRYMVLVTGVEKTRSGGRHHIEEYRLLVLEERT